MTTATRTATYLTALIIAMTFAACDSGDDNESPVASFEAELEGARVNVMSTSTDPDGEIASWAWTFEDGGQETGEEADYTYEERGTYEATLTVTDDGGAEASTTQMLDVPLVDGIYAGTARVNGVRVVHGFDFDPFRGEVSGVAVLIIGDEDFAFSAEGTYDADEFDILIGGAGGIDYSGDVEDLGESLEGRIEWPAGTDIPDYSLTVEADQGDLPVIRGPLEQLQGGDGQTGQRADLEALKDALRHVQ